MAVGTLEEIIDDDHAIISSASGPEYYVSIMSFVDKDLLEPGCSVLLHHKNQAIVGVLQDDTDPMVSVMKLDKAPTESYADIGGLDSQIQEIKVRSTFLQYRPKLFICTLYIRNPLNSHLRIQNSTKKWVSNRQRVSYFTVCLVQERRYLRRPWRTRRPRRSCASLAPSLYRNTWVTARNLYESCSV